MVAETVTASISVVLLSESGEGVAISNAHSHVVGDIEITGGLEAATDDVVPGVGQVSSDRGHNSEHVVRIVGGSG